MARKTPNLEQHEVITVKTEVRELPVPLTPDELAEHEEHAKALKQELTKAKQAIVTRRAVLSGVVKRREEVREVRVALQTDMTDRKYLEVREDTGEVISERPLRPEEMQRKLGLVLPIAGEKSEG